MKREDEKCMRSVNHVNGKSGIKIFCSFFLLAVLILCMMVCAAGCGSKKRSIIVEYGSDVSLELVSSDGGLSNVSTQVNKVTVAVKKDGEYHIVVKDDNLGEITITVTDENGKISVSDDSGQNLTVISQ